MNLNNILRVVLCWAIFGGAPVVVADPELPLLGENASLNLKKEIELGSGLFKKLREKGYVIDDPLLSRYLQDVGESLLASLDVRVRDYHFYIVKDDSINAFAAPGGYIAVNAGLINVSQSEDELASVLAHEIAHVELMHSMQMMEKAKSVNMASVISVLAAILISSQDPEAASAIVYTGMAGSVQTMINFTRANEYEADRLGVEVLKKSAYNPQAMADFMKILQSREQGGELAGIEYLRTHPVSSNRIAEITSRIAKLEKKQPNFTRFQQFKDYLLYQYPNKQSGSAKSRFSLALEHTANGRYKEAEKIYQELVRSDPDSLWFKYALAENMEYQGRFVEASRLYKRTLVLYPDDIAIAGRLIKVLVAQGQAEKALETAMSLFSKHKHKPEIYRLLVTIYKPLGNEPLRRLAEADYHWYNGHEKHAKVQYKKLLSSGMLNIADEENIKEKLAIN